VDFLDKSNSSMYKDGKVTNYGDGSHVNALVQVTNLASSEFIKSNVYGPQQMKINLMTCILLKKKIKHEFYLFGHRTKNSSLLGKRFVF
jgi:hypothetical protein